MLAEATQRAADRLDPQMAGSYRSLRPPSLQIQRLFCQLKVRVKLLHILSPVTIFIREMARMKDTHSMWIHIMALGKSHSFVMGT